MPRRPNRAVKEAPPPHEKPPSNDLPRMLSIAEVGEIFNREPRTIRDWIDRGLISRVKVGNSVFIPWTEIEAICDGKRSSKTSSNNVKK
jgi:hypothetical protein